MVNYIRRWKIWIIVIIILAVIITMYRGNSNVPVEAMVVAKGDVVEEVSVTGRVKSGENVDLAFERTGKVSGIYVKVGDRVGRGTILARIGGADLMASLARAQAGVDTEKAGLLALQNGSSINDIEIAKVKYENAKLSESNKQTLLVNALSGSYVKTDGNINYYVDQFFSNPNSSSPKFNLTSRLDLNGQIESGRLTLQTTLADFAHTVDTANVDLGSGVPNAIKYLSSIRIFVSLVANAVNELTSSAGLSATVVAGYKADISTVRTSIETEISNITASYQAWLEAKASANLLHQQYEATRSPARLEDIGAQTARVARAQADVGSAYAELAKAVIVAPFNSIVTRQDFKLGETVSTADAKISLIDESGFDIETDIPEADIATVATAQPAVITLDAYGSEVKFDAIVVSIEPAERVIDGVATYRTILHFVTNDKRVKSGMTANVTIITNISKGTLYVPSRLVNKTPEGEYYVLVGADYETAKRQIVEIGLLGSDGRVEIISGVSEGDALIVEVDTNGTN